MKIYSALFTFFQLYRTLREIKDTLSKVHVLLYCKWKGNDQESIQSNSTSCHISVIAVLKKNSTSCHISVIAVYKQSWCTHGHDKFVDLYTYSVGFRHEPFVTNLVGYGIWLYQFLIIAYLFTLPCIMVWLFTDYDVAELSVLRHIQ